MTYSNFTVKDTRGDPIHRFVIGPTIAFKVTNNSRFDLSTLFGTTGESPAVQVFAVFSYFVRCSHRSRSAGFDTQSIIGSRKRRNCIALTGIRGADNFALERSSR
jgi:hypothetical protein